MILNLLDLKNIYLNLDAKHAFEELLRLKIEFVREEVEIRIDSMKDQLDKAYEEFSRQLNECKELILK